MGSSTPNLDLYKPDSGETGWAAAINSNFDKIDDGAALINVYYVDKNGDDTNGNGSIHNPYQTISAVLTTIGSAANSSEFNDATKRHYVIRIAPGVYTENLTVPKRPHILFELDGVEIVGDVTQTWTSGLLASGALYLSQLVFRATGTRGCYSAKGDSGSAHIQCGILGDLTLDGSSSGFPQVIIEHSGVTGDVELTGSFGGGAQLFLDNAQIGGQVKGPTAGNYSAAVWATGGSDSNPDVGDACGIGGLSQRASYVLLDNVTISNDVDAYGMNSGRWYNVRFVSGNTYDFTNFSSSIALKMDAASLQAYYDNVSSANRGAIVLGDQIELMDSNAQVTDTVTTTDATPTTIATIPVKDDTVMLIQAECIARRTDAGDRAGYLRTALVYREAGGSATVQGATGTPFTQESDANWDCQINVSGNNALIQVTGAAGKTVNWTVSYNIKIVS